MSRAGVEECFESPGQILETSSTDDSWLAPGSGSNSIVVYRRFRPGFVQIGQRIIGDVAIDALSFSGNGQRLAVGRRSSLVAPVQIYDYDEFNDSWVSNITNQSMITGNGILGSLGIVVSLSPSGERLAVGEVLLNSVRPGQVFIFDLESATSTWIPAGSVQAGVNGNGFGKHLKLAALGLLFGGVEY